MRMGVIAALTALFVAACAEPQSAPLSGEALVARGEYIVNGVGLCNDCHTPFTPQGPDMTRSLQGAPVLMTPTIEVPWATVAPPIAGVPAHFTNEQFAAFLQTGVRPDGSRARLPMPQYRMSEDDARAVTAYIGSLPTAPQQ